jgi:hypothetical protein
MREVVAVRGFGPLRAAFDSLAYYPRWEPPGTGRRWLARRRP